jgi:hypothetical protein
MSDRDPWLQRPPHHPDFDRLSEIVIEGDKLAQELQDVKAVIGELADPDTALYFAQQRAVRLARISGLPEDPSTIAGLTALWLDALWVGYKLHHEHGPVLNVPGPADGRNRMAAFRKGGGK